LVNSYIILTILCPTEGMVNKTKYKEVQEEIQDVSRALRESTNNLVRNLKENPNVSGASAIVLVLISASWQ
jgi:uncharacterized protein YbjQ (UPF0145 family)